MDNQHYPVYYHSYIERVPEGNLIELFDFSLSESLKTLVMIPESKGDYQYESGKWSIKDLLQHLIDTERIFNFRALAFSRGEKHEIAGYDHNTYVENAKADQRTVKSLLEELRRLRASTIDLFKSFDEEQLKREGKANGQTLSVEQIGNVIIGHEMHHLAILEARYL